MRKPLTLKLMHKLLLILSFGLLYCNMYGQEAQNVTVRNNKVDISQISPEYQQIFPDFRSAQIVYKGMTPIKCMANYNFLLDEILYVDGRGEKMAIANPGDLKEVVIDGRKFVYSPKGYLEIIEKGDASLSYKWICRISGKNREGAMGLKTDAPGIYQMKRISFDAKEWNMAVDEEVVTHVEVRAYLLKNDKLIQIKGLQSFLKAFHENRELIKSYAESNQLDLKKEVDLRKLVGYANGL